MFLYKLFSKIKPASFSTEGYETFKEENFLKKRPIGIYVHIPFCERLCSYCGFNRYVYEKSMFEKYLNALTKEIGMYREKTKMQDALITRIYLGGGTPSLLSEEELSALIETIKTSFTISENIQIGMEGTTDTTNREMIKAFHSCGGDRLSFGIQTFNQKLLEIIGRKQNLENIPRVIKCAHEIGIQNINIDLIYGLPSQQMLEWEDDLYRVIDLNVEQISIYPLMLLPNAELTKQTRNGSIDLPNKSRDAMYERAVKILTQAGYHYNELYAFHKSPKRFRVYCTFEQNDEYIGMGAGAHSIAFGQRNYNSYDIKEYIETIEKGKFPIVVSRKFSQREMMTMWFMYELGVWHRLNMDKFADRYGVDFKKNFGRMMVTFKLLGLVKENDRHIYTTRRGKLFFNNYFENIITQCAIPNPPYRTIAERNNACLAHA